MDGCTCPHCNYERGLSIPNSYSSDGKCMYPSKKDIMDTTDEMPEGEMAYRATPHEDLIREIMDCRIAKNERGHAAAKEIAALRAEVEGLKAELHRYKNDGPDAMGKVTTAAVQCGRCGHKTPFHYLDFYGVAGPVNGPQELTGCRKSIAKWGLAGETAVDALERCDAAYEALKAELAGKDKEIERLKPKLATAVGALEAAPKPPFRHVAEFYMAFWEKRRAALKEIGEVDGE